MSTDDQPSLKIELGLSPSVGASIEDMRKRAVEQTELVVAASAELAHLRDPSFISRCPVIVVDGMYVLVIPIEPAPQAEFEGFRSRRGKAALLRARDAAVQAAVEMFHAGACAGAELLRTVAHIVDTSPNAQRELRHLEVLRGVDTGPARRFLYRRRGAFNATIEQRAVLFEGTPVRPSQQVGESIQVVAKLLPPSSETVFAPCEVIHEEGSERLEGVSAGGRKDFRLADLEPWQRVALAGAREAGAQIRMGALNRIGTCSLEYGPADVTEVKNWTELQAAAAGVLLQRPTSMPSVSSNDEHAVDSVATTDDKDEACG